jgi:hypothetical protein
MHCIRWMKGLCYRTAVVPGRVGRPKADAGKTGSG